MRNYLVLFSALLPFLFVVISLIIDQQIPVPGDNPPLLMSYTYNPDENITVGFIRSYEHLLKQSTKPAILFDLTLNKTQPCQYGKPTDVVSYLACIGQRSLLELSDRYLIGAKVLTNSSEDSLDITGLFNNQPYHIPSVSLNYLTNALLRQYASPSMMNSTIYVVNHPVEKRKFDFFILFVAFFSYHVHYQKR
jgi:hypothetical protein